MIALTTAQIIAIVIFVVLKHRVPGNTRPLRLATPHSGVPTPKKDPREKLRDHAYLRQEGNGKYAKNDETNGNQ